LKITLHHAPVFIREIFVNGAFFRNGARVSISAQPLRVSFYYAGKNQCMLLRFRQELTRKVVKRARLVFVGKPQRGQQSAFV